VADLDHRVEVELSSEDQDWPIEGALLLGGTKRWRAASPGPQTISLNILDTYLVATRRDEP
jgi:hypothetical protein